MRKFKRNFNNNLVWKAVHNEMAPAIKLLIQNGRADHVLLTGLIGNVFMRAQARIKSPLGIKNEDEVVAKAHSLIGDYPDVFATPVDIAIDKDGETFYQITNYDKMNPFFMSIVSDSNHWMFISSNGGLTAGRKNSEYALFPYYTDDKITESADITGNKSIFKVSKDNQEFMWEPLAVRSLGSYSTTQNLYKNRYGNKIIFEEVNHDLELIYRYQWSSSNAFGFVKKSKLINTGKEAVKVSLLDGIQNILPYGVNEGLQNSRSNLDIAITILINDKWNSCTFQWKNK